MIEVAMGFGLGTLATCVLTLVVVPFVHERAVRLTTQKLLAVTPSSSLVEVQAQQDLLRAEFAMSAYRFESRLAAMRVKEAALSAEISKKAGEISRLKIALDERSSTIAAYQTREQLRTRLARGDSPQQIIDDYVNEYGTASLAIPPDKGAMRAIYVAPLLAIIGGGFGLVLLLRRWRANAKSESPRPDDEKEGSRDDYDDRIDADLKELDDG